MLPQQLGPGGQHSPVLAISCQRCSHAIFPRELTALAVSLPAILPIKDILGRVLNARHITDELISQYAICAGYLNAIKIGFRQCKTVRNNSKRNSQCSKSSISHGFDAKKKEKREKAWR